MVYSVCTLAALYPEYMTTAFPDELTAAASGPIWLPGPEIVTGLDQVPVAVARMMAWIFGVGLFTSQTARAEPFGARAKYIWPILVSPLDRITGDETGCKFRRLERSLRLQFGGPASLG